MSWLTVGVTDGKGVGLPQVGHRQAEVVTQFVTKGADGELVIPDGNNIAVVADEVRFGAGGFLACVELLRCTPCSLASSQRRQAPHAKEHARVRAGQR
eukprot:6209362-Pleurochrysis_carterae.AAC.1